MCQRLDSAATSARRSLSSSHDILYMAGGSIPSLLAGTRTRPTSCAPPRTVVMSSRSPLSRAPSKWRASSTGRSTSRCCYPRVLSECFLFHYTLKTKANACTGTSRSGATSPSHRSHPRLSTSSERISTLSDEHLSPSRLAISLTISETDNSSSRTTPLHQALYESLWLSLSACSLFLSLLGPLERWKLDSSLLGSRG